MEASTSPAVILTSCLDHLESFVPCIWDPSGQFSEVNNIDINMSAPGKPTSTPASKKDKSILLASPISASSAGDNKAIASTASAPLVGNEDNEIDAEGKHDLDNTADGTFGATM